jgi:nucleoside-diphosphate-sugar epimerase
MMIHAAARGEQYACFVQVVTRIPFMVMPDAIQAILTLEQAPLKELSRQVYNVNAFNVSPGELYDIVRRGFPNAHVSFQPDPARQAIVDSWPEDVDTSAAVHDWGWKPQYPLVKAFDEYLFPAIRRRYSVI